jgi:FkbM family methyltransferase
MSLLKMLPLRFRYTYLKKLDRYKYGIFFFKNMKIEYVDSLSLYHEFKDIFENKIYHFESQTKTPFILDAGGYIGLSTLYFKYIYPDAKIITFEPDPSIFKVLKNNVEKNKLGSVTLVNAALGAKDGTMLFFADGADGGFCIDKDVLGKVNNKSLVSVVQLSNYIDRPVDLLKMNIEGMEGDVFEEISHKLHLVKELIFEYHAFYNLPQSLGKILNLLDSKGFRYLITDATNAKIQVPFVLRKNYKCFNLVYAKNYKFFE